MIEVFLVAIIIFSVLLYTNRIDKYQFLEDNKDKFMILKEKNYDFLLKLRYGDNLTEQNLDTLFMRRIIFGLVLMSLCFFLFITKLNFLNTVICILVGYGGFKYNYIKLQGFYKKHLNTIDSMLPYYLKNLEILVHHYTVPVALSKSVEDAPDVFKPGLKKMLQKIESGDSSVDPYMEFAQEYPVRDSMRMMRLLYRLGLGEQEKKHEQLISFAKSVSSLQLKAREVKYSQRLDKMEKKTLIMLVCTGGGALLLLLASIISLFINAM